MYKLATSSFGGSRIRAAHCWAGYGRGFLPSDSQIPRKCETWLGRGDDIVLESHVLRYSQSLGQRHNIFKRSCMMKYCVAVDVAEKITQGNRVRVDIQMS